MAIEYTVSQNGQRIDVYPKGVLDVKETMDYFARITKDTKIKQGAVEVVNFKDVTDFMISYSDSEKITQNYQGPKSAQLIDKTIFVCETDLAFGIGRMLQTFHEITNPEHKVFVVRTESGLESILQKY